MVRKIIELLLLAILIAVGCFLAIKRLPAYYYNKGIEFYEKGYYDSAISEFKKAIKIDPKPALLHYGLAGAFRDKQALEEAVIEYKKTIELEPQNIKAFSRLIEIYLNKEDYQEALNFLKQAEKIAPQDKDIEGLSQRLKSGYYLGKLNAGINSFLKGDKEKAYALLNETIQIMPDFAYAHYALGKFYFIDKNFSMAEQATNQVLAIDPEFWPAFELLGDIYYERNDFTKAIEFYQSAVNLNPHQAILYNNLSLAYMEIEQYQGAVKFMGKAYELDPENINILYGLASVNRDNKNFSAAESLYRKLIATKPDYPNAHNDLGDIYKQRGRAQEALSEYSKEAGNSSQKLLSEPNNVFLLNSLAYAYGGLGEYEKAEEAIRKTIAIKPDYRQAYLTLAHIQQLKGDLDSALANMNKAKSLSKDKIYVNRIQDELAGQANIFLNPDEE